MKFDITKEWCLAAAVKEAASGGVKAGGPSGLRPSETESPASAFAVAGGCLPVWSAGLFALTA